MPRSVPALPILGKGSGAGRCPPARAAPRAPGRAVQVPPTASTAAPRAPPPSNGRPPSAAAPCSPHCGRGRPPPPPSSFLGLLFPRSPQLRRPTGSRFGLLTAAAAARPADSGRRGGGGLTHEGRLTPSPASIAARVPPAAAAGREARPSAAPLPIAMQNVLELRPSRPISGPPPALRAAGEWRPSALRRAQAHPEDNDQLEVPLR